MGEMKGAAATWARGLAEVAALRLRQRRSGLPVVACGRCRGDTRVLPGVLPQRVRCGGCGGWFSLAAHGDGLMIAADPTPSPAPATAQPPAGGTCGSCGLPLVPAPAEHVAGGIPASVPWCSYCGEY